MRRVLFASSESSPDDLSNAMRRSLIAYAYAVWVYRLFLFLGIAIIVYHYAFKVLGVILFAVEIVYFIARPIWNEMKRWWQMRLQIASHHRWKWSLSLLAAVLTALIVPWSTRVEVPAIISAADIYHAHAKQSARVAFVHVKEGEFVEAGAPIATLNQSDLSQNILLARTRLRLAMLQFDRRGADSADKEDSGVIESTIEALRNRIQGLERERQDLIVRAPTNGRIVEVGPELHSGRWISQRESIATLLSLSGHVARGYVAEVDVNRIRPGSTGVFIPEQAVRRTLQVVVTDVAVSNSAIIELIELASTAGGRVAARTDSKGRAVTANAQYLVRLEVLDTDVPYEVSARGLVSTRRQTREPVGALLAPGRQSRPPRGRRIKERNAASAVNVHICHDDKCVDRDQQMTPKMPLSVLYLRRSLSLWRRDLWPRFASDQDVDFRPAFSRAMIIFIICAVPSPISKPITSRSLC